MAHDKHERGGVRDALRSGEAQAKVEADYVQVRDYTRGLVEASYGSVYAFTMHPDFTERFGLGGTDSQRALARVYLSNTAAETAVKSAPFLSKVLAILDGRTLTCSREVIHHTHFWLDKPLPATASALTA